MRIIPATHQNLEQRVQEGKFREDLSPPPERYPRSPGRRQRREDIPRLARHSLYRSPRTNWA
ncbi:sigma 54-interacting transcriptional regulator [Escherichia coli]